MSGVRPARIATMKRLKTILVAAIVLAALAADSAPASAAVGLAPAHGFAPRQLLVKVEGGRSRQLRLPAGVGVREAAQDPGLVATELADYLVGRNVPFREAHEIVGKVLRAAEQDGKSIRELPIARLKEFSPAFGDDLGNALTVESALARKTAPGGTSPAAVAAALADFKKRIAAANAATGSAR